MSKCRICDHDAVDFCRICDAQLCEEHIYHHTLSNLPLCLYCFMHYSPPYEEGRQA